MRIQYLHAVALHASHGLRLRLLHGVEDRVHQIQRDDDQDARQRIGALNLPGNAAGMRGDGFRARLRPHPVRLNIFFERHAADRIRIRIIVRQMRARAGIRVGENDFRAHFEAAANGLHKRIAGLDRHIYRLLVLALVRIKYHRHLGQPAHRAPVGKTQRGRQFECDHLRARAQNRLAHFDGKFQPSGNHRKIGEASALKTRGIRKGKVDFAGHGAAPLPPEFAGWQSPTPRSRGSAP